MARAEALDLDARAGAAVAKNGSEDGGGDWVVSAKAGESLFHEGDPATHLFIVESGQVEMVKAAGADSRRLALFEAGEFLGEVAAAEGAVYPAMARAVSDARLLRIDANLLGQLVRQRPEIALLMVRRLTRQVWQLLHQRQATARAPSEGPPAAAKPGSSKGSTTSIRKAAAASGPRLVVAATGKVLALPARGEALVGRADPKARVRPEIELSAYDTQRSLSRRHARILCESGTFFVCEEPGVPNGTFVNDERLSAGERRQLKDGDEVRFGLVKTTLRTS